MSGRVKNRKSLKHFMRHTYIVCVCVCVCVWVWAWAWVWVVSIDLFWVCFVPFSYNEVYFLGLVFSCTHACLISTGRLQKRTKWEENTSLETTVCVCVCVCVLEILRERERETDRQTNYYLCVCETHSLLVNSVHRAFPLFLYVNVVFQLTHTFNTHPGCTWHSGSIGTI